MMQNMAITILTVILLVVGFNCVKKCSPVATGMTAKFSQLNTALAGR